MTLMQGTGAKGGRVLGTKRLGPWGIPVPCDPSYTPHILAGPWRVTSGVSHLRGHSQGHSAQKKSSLGTYPLPIFPLTQGAFLLGNQPTG